MPLYPVVNQITGEEKDINLSVAEYSKWRENNPDWDRDWSKGCASLRSGPPSAYSADAIADSATYEDKNNSSHENSFETAKDVESSMAKNNAQVKDKFRIT